MILRKNTPRCSRVKKGMPVKPLRTALGSPLIQKQYGYSDRELVEWIRENQYYQFFIGLLGYQDEEPFIQSFLVEFRKRLTDDILSDINEMIIAYNTSDDIPPAGGSGSEGSDDIYFFKVHMAKKSV